MEIYREYSTNVNDQEDINETNPTASILSMVISSSHLVFAWYNELTNAILVDRIVISSEDFSDILQSLKLDTSPSLFLLHGKIVSNKQLLDMILSKSYEPSNDKNISNNRDGISADYTKDQYDYIIPKSSSYQLENAMNLICNKLRLRQANHISLSMKPKQSETYYENYHLVASMIPLENTLIQQCLGSLLSYIQSNILSLDDDFITISSLGEYQKKRFMRIDENTFRSLQIFNKDVHPNLLKGQQHHKEGFSLFSLLDRTTSLPGRQKLRQVTQTNFSRNNLHLFR